VIAAQYGARHTADDVANSKTHAGAGQQPCHPRRSLLRRKRHHRRRNRRPRCGAGLHCRASLPTPTRHLRHKQSNFPKTDVFSLHRSRGRTYLVASGRHRLFRRRFVRAGKEARFGRPSACRMPTCSTRKSEELPGNRSQAGTSSPRTIAPVHPDLERFLRQAHGCNHL